MACQGSAYEIYTLTTTPKRRNCRIPEEVWITHKDQILQLRLNNALKEIRRIMLEEKQFDARLVSELFYTYLVIHTYAPET